MSGGLAALGVLAVAAAGTAVAVGHGDQEGRDTAIREGASHDRPKNVIFLSATAWALQEITAARYYQASTHKLNVDRLPFTGFDTTWSVKPGAAPPYLPDYDPDSASTGTDVGDRAEDDRRAHLPGPEHAPTNVPGANLKTVLELAQKQGKKVGNVSTAEITDATPAGSRRTSRCAAARARRTWRPARRRPRPPAASARSPSRRSTTRSTCCSAAAAAGSSRRSPAAPTPARRSCSRRRARATSTSPTRPASTASTTPTSRCSACSTRATCRSSGAARQASLGKGNAAGRCTEDQRPANEPSLAAMTTQGDRACSTNRQGLLPPGRGRLDRQAGPRHQRLRPDRRDGRLRRGDRRRARLPAQPPGHAGRRHRRPLAHQPDRREDASGTGCRPATRRTC